MAPKIGLGCWTRITRNRPTINHAKKESASNVVASGEEPGKDGPMEY